MTRRDRTAPSSLQRLRLSRRGFLAGGAAGAAVALGAPVLATEELVDIAAMKPGEFAWHPERQPTGPVSIIVSLDQQRVHVYRNGVRIAVSTCSSGKPGHETPTGVFVVLQKDKDHHSSTYDDAAMPNMNRLTWDGIALHAGKLPGYPASHGCVRLPMEFSADLFGITHIGTPVIIAGTASDPYAITHPGPILNGYARSRTGTGGGRDQRQAASLGLDRGRDRADHDAARLVGRRHRIVIQDDQEVDRGSVTFTGDPKVGQHVFVLQPGARKASSSGRPSRIMTSRASRRWRMRRC